MTLWTMLATVTDTKIETPNHNEEPPVAGARR